MYHKYYHIFNFVFLYMPSAAKSFWYIINIAVFPFFFLVCQFPPQDQYQLLYRTLLRPISVNVNGLGLLARDFNETILTVRPVREYGAVGLKQALQNEELC